MRKRLKILLLIGMTVAHRSTIWRKHSYLETKNCPEISIQVRITDASGSANGQSSGLIFPVW